MKDIIYIGPVPYDEHCAQVGEDGFRGQATKEMNAYIAQLYRRFPELENNNVYLKIKWEHHDFGTYGEVVVVYDPDDEEQSELAFKIDSYIPSNWDYEALVDLGLEDAYS